LAELTELIHARIAAVAAQTALRNRLGAAHSSLLKDELRIQIGSNADHVKRLEQGILALIASDARLLGVLKF
jgi:hypothetical protein